MVSLPVLPAMYEGASAWEASILSGPFWPKKLPKICVAMPPVGLTSIFEGPAWG
jgi:hypothetical protein